MNCGKRWILAALLMLGCLLVISCGGSDEGVTGDGAVSGTKSECEHRLDGGALLRAATCEQDGEMLYTCTLCGYTETRRIPAGHVVAVDAAVPATCLAEGKTEGSHCSVCGVVLKEQKTLPKTEHRPVAMPSVEATCVSAGHTGGSHCEACGFVFEEPQVLPKKAHTPVSDPAVPATCMTEGKTYGSHCSVCGEVLQAQQVVPKSGHRYAEGWTSDETHHWHASACGHDSEVSGKAEHTFSGWIIDRAATEETAGEKHRVCTVCYRTETVEIPKLVHTHKYAEGWTSDGTYHWHASACGHESEISGRAEHTFSGWIIDRVATEETAGEKHRVCTVCYRTETVEIPKLAHTHKYAEGWTSDETHHWHASACGHESEVSGKAEHTYHDGFCSVCGAKDPRIVVKVYIDGYLDQTLYTSEKQGYRITPPEKPDDIMTNPNSKEYFYAWFVDANFQTPLFDSTEFHADGAIYGKWIKVYFDDFSYTVNEGKATITEFTNTYRKATVVIVPAYINGFPVTAIGAGAFKGDKLIRTVILCNGIREIGSSAFAGCNSMTRIDLPESLVAIGSSAFNNCTTLPEVRLPENLESIGEYAFTGCRSLTEIAIPGSVKSIGRYAFRLCTGLTCVTMSEGVESLSDYVFSGCESLTEVTMILGNVKSIGERAFENCTGLTSITIPEGVSYIGKYAFSGCKGVTKIIIPGSVKEINFGAFDGCIGLESITVSEDNTKYRSSGNCLIVGESLIFGCKRSIIPSDGSVTRIDGYAFDGCTGLLEIVIPEGITEISIYAFRGCSGLTSITIPVSVRYIGSYVFYQCSGLKSVNFKGPYGWSVGNIKLDVYAVADSSTACDYLVHKYCNRAWNT